MSDEIKTYRLIGQSETLIFEISDMGSVYEKRKGQPDHPHRHDFYTVLVLESGSGSHILDFKEYPLKGQSVYFIAPGQVHQVIETSKPTGYAILFSLDFLTQNNIPIQFIEDLHLFKEYGESPPLEFASKEFKKLCDYASEMLELTDKNSPYQYEALGSLLKLFLIKCTNACELNNEDNTNAGQGQNVLRSFKGLINAHFKEWHAIADYAETLNITPDYLNRIVKSQTGKTAKEHIQSRITVGAKRLLYFSDLTNKEISYELGFSEPANFSAFFKKCVGMSPSSFRESIGQKKPLLNE